MDQPQSNLSLNKRLFFSHITR